ncbi:LrgB family protein [Bibersteinia trehalosi]|uniref:LrgB family protein n=1 Tax=Bibersteinia trehalosi TaxID=47735 RepID=A0A426FIM7_BIBTR|nr:LrgB family protein [Bibersteinia trehalosi]RRN04616.1 LrgB family protein [Bibersteinia trehalosi]
MTYLFSGLTIMAFLIAIRLSRLLKSSIFNPFILALLLIIAVLLLGDFSYQEYYAGNQPLNSLLNLSIVALALPFYEQLHQVKRKWKQILALCFISAVLTMLSGMYLAKLFGGSEEIIASIAGKSVTMPIALLISQELGGNNALTGIGVMIAGLTGAVFGTMLLGTLKVKRLFAIGLSMGAVSHALGTARSMEIGNEAASFAAIAFVLCGVFSSFIAPLLLRLIL